ncbi:MAG: tRNA preQ1(34) S-adenosylmethionine ribosyltransferase-isomerase QueA [Patescibacteria group bacterium]
MDFRSYLKQFDYPLPENLIAQKPTLPRDKAKLLVYSLKTHQVGHDIFLNLDKYLPKNSVIIFNQTKVIPARIYTKKSTGGKVEVFCLGIADNQIKALISPGQKTNTKLYLTNKPQPTTDNKYFLVIKQKNKIFYLKPSFPINQLIKILNQYGQTPIPPYIKHSPLSEKELRKQYQTIFAKIPGSVAAPTASMHFTNRLLRKLKNKGHQIGFINLNVNLGTFAPLEQKHLKSNKLYQEEFFIPKQTLELIKKAKKHSWPIIACGTTVVRTLESSKILSAYLAGKTKSSKIKWETAGLFIRPGYKFKIINSLITNFHLPQSSLLMLVSAFAGRKKILELYQLAIKNNYRFYSFGDGMLII